jgi:hypothetical protein
MTTEVSATDVLVDTALISLEILVYGERNADGALLEDLSLHVLFALDTVGGLGVVLVIRERGRVRRLIAAGGALRGRIGLHIIASGHIAGRLNVVGTRSHAVRLAGLALTDLVVISTSSDTGVNKPAPSTSRLSAIAAHRERALTTRAARHGILGCHESSGITSGHAVSVIEGLSRGKGPA